MQIIKSTIVALSVLALAACASTPQRYESPVRPETGPFPTEAELAALPVRTNELPIKGWCERRPKSARPAALERADEKRVT